MNDGELLMTRREIAAIFKISLATVIRMEASGKLKPYQIGANAIRYKVSDVREYLNSCLAVA